MILFPQPAHSRGPCAAAIAADTAPERGAAPTPTPTAAGAEGCSTAPASEKHTSQQYRKGDNKKKSYKFAIFRA